MISKMNVSETIEEDLHVELEHVWPIFDFMSTQQTTTFEGHPLSKTLIASIKSEDSMGRIDFSI